MRVRPLHCTMAVGLAVTLGAVVTACGAAAPAQWTQHEDPSGFVVEHPPKWTVEVTAAAITIRGPDKKACVVVMPFSFESSGSSAQVLKSAPSVFGTRFAKAKVSGVKQESESPDISSARMSYSLGSEEGRADLVCAVDGSTGALFAMAAPKGRYSAFQPTLARIQNSYRRTQPAAHVHVPEKELSTPPGASVSASAPAPPNPAVPEDEVVLSSQAGSPTPPTPSAPGSAASVKPDTTLSYVKWTDPVESAFTVDVPAGWRVSGGTKRLSEVEARSAVEVTSPDGSVKLVIGDAALGLFVTPNPVTQSMGLSEGQYTQSDGFRLQVLRYQNGKEFAKAYARGRAADESWGEVRFTSEYDRPDLEKQAAANPANQSPNIKVSAGEVRFTCSPEGKPASGFCVATTVLNSPDSTDKGMWLVSGLALCLSPPQKADSSVAILKRVANSLAVSPEWLKKQQERVTKPSGASSGSAGEN